MDEKEIILIVDDDESTRRSLRLIFEKMGYETETAGTGREAIEKAQGRFFNLALLDIRLPDMAGIQLLAPLKEMHPDMAVILVTGYASLKTAVQALNEGASGYITKPLDMDEVLVTVREALEKERLVMENRRLFQEVQRELAERKRAEEELKQTMAELARSNQELEQFAYVASHDLQEPLRMVASYVQLLARRYQGRLDADADEFIAYAVDGATRMQALINDLLAYSRVGTRGKPFEPTDCEAILDQALANLQVAIEENGAAVTHDLLPTVMADATQLTQLFQNLIGNAVKFRGEESLRIHISAHWPSAIENRKSDEWIFSVRDNGIGIDPEYHERIFLIFQRLHTREEYPGTGIGLAICRKIVERHGGRIWVESQPGKGSIFYFTIPMIGGE
jgi:signal transduction histidine kinase